MTTLRSLTDFSGVDEFPAEAQQVQSAAEPVFVVVRPRGQNHVTHDLDRVWAPRYVTTRHRRRQRSKKAMAVTLLLATSFAYLTGWYAGGLAVHHSFDPLQKVLPLAQQWVQQLRSEAAHPPDEPHQ
jgi:hypothetical protein